MVRTIASATLLALWAAGTSAGGFEDGLEAAGRGDYAAAHAAWLPLAEAGHVDAQFNLGLLYDYGLLEPEPDPARAAMWYHAAADQGDAQAQTYLAEMYAKGTGVEQSFERAVEWYRKAAEAGVSRAQYNLGLLYASGRGVALDDVYAFAWLSVAAQDPSMPTRVRDMMAETMSSERLEQARRLGDELRAKCAVQ